MFLFHLFSSCLPGDNKNMSLDMFLPTFERPGVDFQCGSRLFDPIVYKSVFLWIWHMERLMINEHWLIVSWWSKGCIMCISLKNLNKHLHHSLETLVTNMEFAHQTHNCIYAEIHKPFQYRIKKIETLSHIHSCNQFHIWH